MTSTMAALLAPGDVLVAGQALAEPETLLDRLFGDLNDTAGLRLFSGMSLTSAPGRVPPDVELLSFVGLGSNAALLASGRLGLLPCHMSDLSRILTSGPLQADVALVLVSPPNHDGFCSLGAGTDYMWPVTSRARVILAEVNSHVPFIKGDTAIAFERLDQVVYSERPLPEYGRRAPSATETAIAQRIVPHIRNGTCLQIGVGKLGEAILASLGQHSDLGVHAGMVGDTILELMRDGVVTNSKKSIDHGLTVAGSLLASQAGVHLAAQSPSLRLRSIDHTHDPAIISQLSDFLCINSAIEVDLFGQVNSEVVGGRYIGAVGGSVDFLRGATRSPGGRSIVALPSTAAGGASSRVVPRVQHVTALGSDVDIIVTEFGTAELRGVSQGERARRIIDLAAPHHRDPLRAAAAEMGL
ncbi:MAG TPA: acetyl-CoA hydrolase/transferase C-terminal domain-containing protein [Acidimicrobiales bacterium]|nr:acetyl-CoA hydrolase/transferase C-terminal domain-containing protein [Acidimicrobiales bacterium]